MKMTLEQRKRLLDLGFVPGYNNSYNNTPPPLSRQKQFNTAFQKRIKELKEYQQKYGNIDVPTNSGLHCWLTRMRTYYQAFQERRETCLKMEHIFELTNLGFVWVLQPTAGPTTTTTTTTTTTRSAIGLSAITLPTGRRRKTVQEKIHDYVTFVKQNNKFPHRMAKDPVERSLESAAQKWRKMRKLAHQGITIFGKKQSTDIPQECIDALDSIDFKWELREMTRRRRRRSSSSNDDDEDADDTRNQNTKQQKEDGKEETTLDNEHHRQEENTPSNTTKNLSWEEKFKLLVSYKKKHGHCEPPVNHPKLGNFVRNERRQYKYMTEGLKTTMTVDRYRKLVELGFRFQTQSNTSGARKRVRELGGSGSSSSGNDTSSKNKDKVPKRKKEKVEKEQTQMSKNSAKGGEG